MFDRLDDTIVAVSSPAGASVRGIVRLSGPQALDLAGEVFQRADGAALVVSGGHERHTGRLRLDQEASVPAEAYTFRAPASYTRQDLVELHTLGSPPVLAMVLDRLVDLGGRVAEPGEFTGRAFLAGAIDLTEVEGVAAMIHARSDAQLRAAKALLHGQLSQQTRALREELIDLLVLIEAGIDFADEPVEFVAAWQVADTVQRAASAIEGLLAGSISAERLSVLPQVVLVGRPNAGKSTMFNRLTGLDRAIQSAIAGTTRDVISAAVHVDGGEIMLSDTAGFRDEQPTNRTSAEYGVDDRYASLVEIEMTSKARAALLRALATADLILPVVDLTDRPDEAVRDLMAWLPARRCVTVGNKKDAASAEAISMFISAVTRTGRAIADHLVVSAQTGDGIDALRDALKQAVFTGDFEHGAEWIALSNRQREAMSDAAQALGRASDLARDGGDLQTCAELIAIDLRAAISALSLLTGEVTTEDLLGRIFARFCIGK